MVEPIFDYQFRLILIGDSTVGKSSLLKYFTDGKFFEVSPPLHVELELGEAGEAGVAMLFYAICTSFMVWGITVVLVPSPGQSGGRGVGGQVRSLAAYVGQGQGVGWFCFSSVLVLLARLCCVSCSINYGSIVLCVCLDLHGLETISKGHLKRSDIAAIIHLVLHPLVCLP